MGQFPGGKSVGAEPRMNHGQGTLDQGMVQVLIEGRNLMSHEEAFINESHTGKAGDVKGIRFFDTRSFDQILHTLANHIKFSFELGLMLQMRILTNKNLSNDGFDFAGHRANGIAVNGDVTPAQDLLALFLDDLFKEGLTLLTRLFISWQEHHPNAIMACLRQGQSYSQTFLT